MSEHTLYNKKKLCYTEVTDFTDFQGIGRDPLYKRYDSVYSIIEQNIEPQYRDFLAHPVYSDEDQILWYLREWNETPCAYSDLSEAERVKYTEIKEKTIAAYKNALNTLTGEDKQILTGALKYVDDDFMFCYDDKVVLVAWGMVSDSNKHVVKGTVIHDLKIESSHKIRFVVGDNGILSDKLAGIVSRPDGAVLSHIDLPHVTPKKGYAFKGWEPDPLGVTVNSSLTFTAMYDVVPVEDEQEKVHVSFVVGEGGSIEGTTELMVDKGTHLENLQFPTAIPHMGYTFVGWDEGACSQTIDKDVTISAVFEHQNVACRFVSGEYGSIEGSDSFSLPFGSILGNDSIPVVNAKKGYKFIGWDNSPIDYVLNGDTVFTAQYEEVLPWYKRLWRMFTGKGCLKWLLWLLLLLLFCFLLSWLLRACDNDSVDNTVAPLPKIETPTGDTIDNNGPVKGIVDSDGELPDNNVVAPIIGDDGVEPPIISNPGVPDIIANRLNIYFEDSNVNLEQFIADLAQIYPSDQCQVIGFDRNIPMIQILIPEQIRNDVRENLNAKMPNYRFFIVDESIFKSSGVASGDVANRGWHLDAVDVEEGWYITKGSPDIIVAVVDDGIDATHDILEGRLVKPYNVFTQDRRLSTGQGHGTHVAGLAVGSDIKFNEGVSGIAPNCKLMPIQVFDNSLCTFSSVTSGIMYAIHNGANVINVSIGPNFRGLDILPLPQQEYIAKTQFKNEERVWRRIIKVANDNNVIIVFAAGNDNILANILPENRTDMTVNVAAVDSRIRGADFTNYGKGSNISAPGKGILSSVPVNNYAVFDGTSMAAPIVSGTVALMKSLKPEISVSEILQILRATGKTVPGNMPPMIQVDDALIAIKTGVVVGPKSPVDDRSDVVSDNYVEDDEICDVLDDESDYMIVPDDGASPVHVEPGVVNDDVVWGQVPVEKNPHPGNADNSGATHGVVVPKKGTVGQDKQPGDRNPTDYDAIRKLIEAYKRKINELESLLPENK